MITFHCLTCRKGIKARDELSGKKVKCPKCGKAMLVPEVSPAPHGAASGLPDLPTRPPADSADADPAEQATVAPAEATFGPRANLPPSTEAAKSRIDSAPPSDAPDESELTEFLAPPEQSDEIGRLGPYRVLKILGSGGMGVVFKAEDPKLERAIALKAMLPSLAASNSAKKRFLREAKTAATIKHDNIVHIYQVGEDRGAPYIAMEYLEGESLDARLRRDDRPDIAEIIRIGREIAEGLEAAHERGLIHRDIKPANIWLEASPRRKSGECRAKILDFGLARDISDQAHLTQTGAVIGTPAYMAPEQAGGQPVDHRCDLFSLGCVLYRMCTGEMPFKGKDTMTIICALAMDNPVPPSEVCGDVPIDLSDLVMALLVKKPEDRLGSAQEVIAALTDMAEETPAKTKTRRTAKMYPAGTREKTRIGGAGKTQISAAPARRWLWLGAAAGVLTALGLALLGFMFLLPNDAKQAATPSFAHTPDGKTEHDPVFANPLDRLDSKNIPADELELDQPANLVAILGSRHMRHWGKFDGASFSRDGKLLASFGADHVIRVWDVASMREKLAIRNQQIGWFTQDGKILARAENGLIQLYDVSGSEPKVVTQITEDMDLLAMAHDGMFCVGRSLSDRTIRIFDLSSKPPRQHATFKDPLDDRGAPLLACMDSKGMKLATAPRWSDSLRLFDVSTAQVKELPTTEFTTKQPIRSLAFSPDGKLACGYDSGPELWDVSGPRPKLSRKISHKSSSEHMLITADGKSLIFGNLQESAMVDLTSPDSSPRPLPRKWWGQFVSISPDGKLLAGIEEFNLRLMDISGPEPVERLQRRDVTYGGLLFSLDGSKLFNRTMVSTEIWDLIGPGPKRSELERVGTTFNGSIEGRLVLSSDGKLLVNRMDSRLQAWDVSGAVPVFYQETGGFHVGPTAFAPNSHRLFFGSDNTGAVRIWDVNGKSELRTFQALPKGIRHFGVTRDGKFLALDEDTVQFWDVTGPEPQKAGVLKIPGKLIQNMVLAPDDKTLALAVSGQGWLYDLSEKEPRRRAVLSHMGDFAPAQWVFAPDSKTLAAIESEKNTVTIWNSANGTKTGEWKLPGPPKYLAFSSDSRYLAIANLNTTVYILRLAH